MADVFSGEVARELAGATPFQARIGIVGTRPAHKLRHNEDGPMQTTTLPAGYEEIFVLPLSPSQLLGARYDRPTLIQRVAEMGQLGYVPQCAALYAPHGVPESLVEQLAHDTQECGLPRRVMLLGDAFEQPTDRQN